jgi:hypothetical protein
MWLSRAENDNIEHMYVLGDWLKECLHYLVVFRSILWKSVGWMNISSHTKIIGYLFCGLSS